MTSAQHNLQHLQQVATQLRLHVVNMIAPSRQGYVQQGVGDSSTIEAACVEVLQRKQA